MEIIDLISIMPRTSKVQKRAVIDRVLVHHSGAEGPDRKAGAIASAHYVVHKRGFPGPAYHFWVARTGEIYQLADLADRAWHTGGRANERGVGVALQGNMNRRDLTDAQKASLDWLLCHLRDSLALEGRWLGWHSIATEFGAPKNKSACPGEASVRWLEAWLDRQD